MRERLLAAYRLWVERDADRRDDRRYGHDSDGRPIRRVPLRWE